MGAAGLLAIVGVIALSRHHPEVTKRKKDARKAAGLHVSDRIALRLAVPAEKEGWAAAQRGRIAGEVLADTVDLTHAGGDLVVVDVARV